MAIGVIGERADALERGDRSASHNHAAIAARMTKSTTNSAARSQRDRDSLAAVVGIG